MVALEEGAMPHRGRRSCEAGLWFLSVWEHVLTPRDRDLNPVLGPVVTTPCFLLYHRATASAKLPSTALCTVKPLGLKNAALASCGTASTPTSSNGCAVSMVQIYLDD